MSLARSSDAWMYPFFCLSVILKASRISALGSSCCICLCIIVRNVEKSSAPVFSKHDLTSITTGRHVPCCEIKMLELNSRLSNSLITIMYTEKNAVHFTKAVLYKQEVTLIMGKRRQMKRNFCYCISCPVQSCVQNTIRSTECCTLPILWTCRCLSISPNVGLVPRQRITVIRSLASILPFRFLSYKEKHSLISARNKYRMTLVQFIALYYFLRNIASNLSFTHYQLKLEIHRQ